MPPECPLAGARAARGDHAHCHRDADGDGDQTQDEWDWPVASHVRFIWVHRSNRRDRIVVSCGAVRCIAKLDQSQVSSAIRRERPANCGS